MEVYEIGNAEKRDRLIMRFVSVKNIYVIQVRIPEPKDSGMMANPEIAS